MRKTVLLISALVLLVGCGKPINTTNNGNIYGVVKDSFSDSVLAGATISLAGNSVTATTNASGEYTFTDISVGIKTISATKTNYSTGSATLEVRSGQTAIAPSLTLTPVNLSWQAVGGAGFTPGTASYISLYVDKGTPYIAFRDEAKGGKATVMQYSKDKWQGVGKAGFSSGEVSWTGLYFYNGIPYVAFRDQENNSSEATVMRYTGGSWEAVGEVSGFSTEEAAYNSFYVNNGKPSLASMDFGIKVANKKYSEGSWQAVGSASEEAHKTSLFVYRGTPYLEYLDKANAGKIGLKKYTNSSWEVVGAAELSGAYRSLFVDNGIPYVAYQDYNHEYKATVMKYGP